ncbi:Concanavalin A-like lectin/glucanases superfamily [uncultured Caudovirales phage]|uniref:Concanavalin A-like lectin/glucanases superfamily n=1 Tax=uncultured Caudovirales phage TaxID=2100421 RepID=A0A6J5LEK6_9CAUD|nr:Concanavalin A-like lectin/glucanases superfamily [uncultured Caudovirales phage]
MFSASKTKQVAVSGGITLTKSLRFRSSASAYLNRTPSSTGNPKTYTWSGWVKLGTTSTTLPLFQAATSSTNLVCFYYDGRQLIAQIYNDPSYNTTWNTNAIYSDTSAWYHVVISVDTTQSSATNIVKIYVNGVSMSLIYALNGRGTIAQNTNTQANTSGISNTIGNYNAGGTTILYYDGYMTDVYLIDGQALTPSSFGATNATTGVWQPKAYSGSYGTNGFHLTFANTTSTTTLGYDTSGNSNNWTTNNISLTAGSTYDSMNDVPTLTSATASNYCVLNPATQSAGTISNGNLQYYGPNSWKAIASTILLPITGKWYAEVVLLNAPLSSNFGDVWNVFGFIAPSSVSAWSYNTGTSFYISDTGYYSNYSTGGTGNFTGNTTGTVLGLAFDRSTNQVTIYQNGVSKATVTIGITSGSDLYFFNGSYSATYGSMAVNFGQQGFTYTPPSGYVALNTYNLPTPTIVQGNKYMDATLYTGNGTSQTITNAGGFKPDFFWLKARSAAYDNGLIDTNRGTTNYLISNSTAAETSGSTLTANSNGFSLTTGFNNGSTTYVAWQWQAGQGSNVSNTNGSITSTVSASTTAGFSVVTYTGTGANATVGHGLGVAPSMMIVKSRTNILEWDVYHVSLGATKRLFLDSTSAVDTSINPWNNTAPTSSVFSIGVGLNTNTSGASLLAYCFAPVTGFSAFGSYTGNGSTSGPFIYTGFRPKFILVKCYDGLTNWNIYDSSRNTYNPETYKLIPNLGDAEYTISGGTMNFLSNGFQLINTSTDFNGNGYNYIYMAFAENPFKYANAR